MNGNQLELAAFSNAFLLAREFSRASFFQWANRDLSIRFFWVLYSPKIRLYRRFSSYVRIFNRTQFARDGTIFFLLFFSSLPLREFPSEHKFLLARKIYAKAQKRYNVLRETQSSGHICVELTQMEENEWTFGSTQGLTTGL